MALEINYHLNPGGDATVNFQDGDQAAQSRVSCLHDSLRDLAKLGYALLQGAERGQAVFVFEPGEVHFVVEFDGARLGYELRRYDDWASLNRDANSRYETLMRGETAPRVVAQQVFSLLSKIYSQTGPSRYRELWREHDFPTLHFERLAAALRPGLLGAIDLRLLLVRAVLLLLVVPPVYLGVFRVTDTLFSLYGIAWMPHTIALLVALQTAWFIWTRSRMLFAARKR